MRLFWRCCDRVGTTCSRARAIHDSGSCRFYRRYQVINGSSNPSPLLHCCLYRFGLLLPLFRIRVVGGITSAFRLKLADIFIPCLRTFNATWTSPIVADFQAYTLLLFSLFFFIQTVLFARTSPRTAFIRINFLHGTARSPYSTELQ